jgi:Leucine-rich repeat (LRR) protein
MKKRLLTRLCFAGLLVLLGTGYARANVTLSTANFPDDNFRAAVAAAANVSVGSSFNENLLTSLDLPSLNVVNVTNLKGLELLTGLTYLDISGNSGLTTGADISGLTALQTLKACNCNISSVNATSGSDAYPGAGLKLGSGNSSIKYVDLSDNVNFYSSGNLQYLINLERMILNGCTNYDYWSTTVGSALTKLKYLEMSDCSKLDRIYLPNSTSLQHLKATGSTKLKGFSANAGVSGTTPTVGYIQFPVNLSTLTYLNLSDCSILDSFQAIYNKYQVTSIDTLILANDIGLNGWSPGITAQTGLVYCDLSNTGQTTTSLGFTQNFNALETLILKNNSSFGYSSTIQYLSALKCLDISNCDIFFRSGGLLDYLTPANNPNLETLLCSNSRLGTLTEGLTGFTNLKTVDVSNNVTSGTVNMTQFWVNGSPLLETLNITGDTHLSYLQLNNDGLPRNNFTLIGGDGCSALNSLYLNGNNYATVGGATSDFSSIGSLYFLYLQNNSGFNNGAYTLGASDCGSLKGLDLGNNGFTSFHAPSLPPTLTALMLGKNPSMTSLEMHNNPGIIKMTADTVMSDGSGLYLLGNTALTYMDISGDSTQCNYFQRIGNNFSLQGVPIETLKASYNKFYTFRNLTTVPGGVYETFKKSNGEYGHAASPPSLEYYYYAYWPTMIARPDSASLEQLTGLKYLDLSHCQLKDSVYLHKNTELRYLDVSHNRTITRYTSSPDKGKGYRDSGGSTTVTNRDYPDYKKYLWLADTRLKYPYRQQAYDQEYYTMDYNDTTGLYILDLMDNDKLEYLDISYTGIEQTALTHCHVSNARFIWIQDLHNLKYFYADYNGMRSMGVGTLNGKHHKEALKSLERLSVIGMRGADVTTMQGSMNFLNNGRCPNLHYVNVSYSDFDSIGVHNPSIDTLIVRGNPIHHVDVQDVPAITYIDARECAYKQRGYDPETNVTVAIPDTLTQRFQWTNYNTGVTKDSLRLFTMNGARIGGTYAGAVTTPFSGLRSVRAHHRPNLTTLLVNNSNALTDVYCHFDPKLTKITGFNDLAYPKDSVDLAFGYPADVDSLNLVWVNDDSSLIELNLSHNVNLHYLHAYNDKALGDALDIDGMNLIPNSNLITAWVSNSNLKAFTNRAITLDTLWIWQNPELSQLDVTSNKRLKRFDLHNCMVRELDVSENSMLIDFDCCNQDSINHVTNQKIWPNYTKYGYVFPGVVPTATNEPGKNSIADLNFSSKNLQTVRADNNDLYSMKGLEGNADLTVLTYAHNHINAIDLTGCDNIVTYDCTHNGRGFFEAEYSRWREPAPNGGIDTCNMYYLQLDPLAGDEILADYDSYLGYKAGYDSISGISDSERVRVFDADGFDPDKVQAFTLHSAGPYQGTRHSAPMRSQIVYGSDTVPDSTKIYGKIAVLDLTENPDFPNHHYIEYKYIDGRAGSSRATVPTSTFYMVWTAPSTPTDVEETTEDGLGEATVVSERYFDAAGIEHSEPLSGVNIIVRQMSDGTTQTVKVIR